MDNIKPKRKMKKQSIFIVRHADRYDRHMNKDDYEKACHPDSVHDTPLSDVGLEQSLKLEKYFVQLMAEEPDLVISNIISSPFLRCLQTSHPVANGLGKRLLVEKSLGELDSSHISLPDINERYKYFPLIDTAFESLFNPTGKESFPEGTVERFGKSINLLIDRFLPSYENFDKGDENQAIVVATHAAGVVSIIASLLQCSIDDIVPAHPAGIYRLEREWPNNTWTLTPHLNGFIEHIKHIEGNATVPWPTDSASSHKMRLYMSELSQKAKKQRK